MRPLIIIAVLFVLIVPGCAKKNQDQAQNGAAPAATANNQAKPGDNSSAQGATQQTPSRISRVVFSAREYTTDGSISTYDIFVFDGANTAPLRLTTGSANDRHPVWSPDGSRIAYLAMTGSNVDVIVMDVKNRLTTKVNRAPLQNVLPEVFFWPVSDNIYYATKNNNGATCWVLNLATGDASKVDNFAFGNAVVSANDVVNGAASFSTDASCIAKVSADRKKVTCAAANGSALGEISLAEFGGKPVVLGSWSPDLNSLLVFETDSHRIFVADVKTGLLRSLANGNAAAWSADGSNIIYTSPETPMDLMDTGQHKTVRSSDVFVIPAAGGQERRILMKTCLVEAIAVSAANGPAGLVDFANLAAAGTTAVDTTATAGTNITPPQFTGEPGGNLALLGEFEARSGFISLKTVGSGKAVVTANRLQPGDTKKREIKIFSVENGKFVETGKEIGTVEDEAKYEMKFATPTFKSLNAAEKSRTVGGDLTANAKVLYGGEAKIGNGTVIKRLIIYATVQGDNWQTFAALYRFNGQDWKQEASSPLASGTGKSLPWVNAGLKDMDGDGQPELLIAHSTQIDGGLYETLKVFKVSGN